MDNLLADKHTRFYQYDVLRVLLMTLVVFGHATFTTIQTSFGGIDYGIQLAEAGMSYSNFHRISKLFTDWIYTFHMPLFIALSGTIYGIKRGQEKYDNFNSFVANKVKRLLIPFFVVWILWNAPIKYCTGYYEGVKFTKIFLQMLAPSNVYLWYLEALFLIFVLMFVLDKIQNKAIETGVIILFWVVGVILYRKFGYYHFLGDPLYYLLWFYLGIHIESIIKKLEYKRVLTKVSVLFLFIIQVVLFLLYRIKVNTLISAVLQCIVLPFLMTVVIYYFVDHYDVRKKKIMEVASSYCMGIYLYAEPLNYLLLYLFYTYFGIGVFASEFASAVLWLLRVFLTMVVAIVITWVLKKMKLKYLY